MKIVTAGHRGSVATDDVIREVRDNRRRIFSYSLILLFSILGAAQGAKMCVRTMPWRFSINSALKLWAVGPGCRSLSGTSVGTYMTSAEDPATSVDELCGGNFYAGGVGKCSISDFIEDGGAPKDINGTWCWCKMTHPHAGFWQTAWYHDAVGCNTYCATLCGIMAKSRGANGLFVPYF